MKPYYEDDAVTLYLGDAREILPAINFADHVITDPPFARDVYLRSTISNHQFSSVSLEKLAAGDIGHIDEMLAGVAAEFGRLTRRWAIVFSDAETTWRWRAELQDAGMRYVRTGAWCKSDPMPQFSGDRPAVGFEPCTITHAQGKMRWNGGGHAATWHFGISKGAKRPDHPCPKPLPLMTKIVEQFTDEGEVVLDPFAGSGTTLVAAKNLGRKAIGVELVEKWAEGTANRLRMPGMFS
jgi:site-specific DNA-methyltransferase (adenine-specific)